MIPLETLLEFYIKNRKTLYINYHHNLRLFLDWFGLDNIEIPYKESLGLGIHASYPEVLNTWEIQELATLLNCPPIIILTLVLNIVIRDYL